MNKKLKVATATEDYFDYFKGAFPGLFVLNGTEVPSDLDLLILTGGCDVNPERYGESPSGAIGWSDDRDMKEISLIRSAMYSNTAKILGVCRGLQIMNVAHGGDLWQDLIDPHYDIHGIKHLAPNPFSYMKKVNSMHHQGIKHLGNDYMSAYILAVDDTHSIPEIVSWGRNQVGVQFHPEFFSPEYKSDFFTKIREWVCGDVNMSPETDKIKRYKSPWATVNTTNITLDTESWASAPPLPNPHEEGEEN